MVSDASLLKSSFDIRAWCAHILMPLNQLDVGAPGLPFSVSTISTTRFFDFGSEIAATHTSATRSREISPPVSVFSPETKRPPAGGSALSPPGRTMV